MIQIRINNKKQVEKLPAFCLVPVVGVEPTRYRYHWILSPARLPIPSHRQIGTYNIIARSKKVVKVFFEKITRKKKVYLRLYRNDSFPRSLRKSF